MKWLRAAVSWPVLAGQAVLLAIVCWPMADHWVSYFWILIAAAVLLGELASKLWSPKRQTVSNNVRDESVAPSLWARLRFWAMIAVWMWFAVTLALHFSVRLLP